ncbi:hypothetical protein K9M41_00765 [Candidatus Gracilibacteria bacterium]|nr:hypothetical protein [Candidatus Gracilibacteria bacterium]
MKHDYQSFIFEDYSFDKENKKLILHYSLDEEIFFTEEIIFDFTFVDNINEKALQNALFGTWVMLGISYFKAFLPPKIKFKKQGFTANQAEFFQKTWAGGLGEFFYQNKIDPQGKINFSSNKKTKPTNPVSLNVSGSIVPLGGGKDSLVTTEILKENNEDFVTWTVGEFPFLQNMISKTRVPHLNVRRHLDPKLLDLNAQGALNGHVPISAILAFLGVTSAILTGRKNVILSNEHSASEPTVGDINHQYSKSLEFERDFQTYVHDFISPDLNYFSFLRPLAELKIAQVFCRKYLDMYEKIFSSCNSNYRLTEKSKQITWCGKCPKCAFVFAIFAPFLGRERLISLFGKNLFADKDLDQTFRELLGLEKSKPFECVGEIEEVRKSLELAQEKWPELSKFDFPKSNFTLEELHPHLIPENFYEILRKIVS